MNTSQASAEALVARASVIPLRPRTRWFCVVALVGFLSIGAVLSELTWAHGSIAAGLAALRGYVLFAEHRTASCAPVIAGDKGSVSFDIHNLTRMPAIVYGANTTCDCIVASAMPLKLGPGEHRILTFSVTTHARENAQAIAGSASLLFEPAGPPVTLQFVIPIANSN